MSQIIKIVIFVPIDAAESVRNAMGSAGAGKIGNYDFCSFSTQGIGRFRPLKGANPTIGEVGKIEEVEEEKIEAVCERAKLQEIIDAVKKIHPYEEVPIDIYPIEFVL